MPTVMKAKKHRYHGKRVLVVNGGGSVRLDGALKKLDGITVTVEGEDPHRLRPGQMLVTRLESGISSLPDNTPLLLVNAWGCGGEMLEAGEFLYGLDGESFCFAPKKEGAAAGPRSLGDYQGGVFQVLASGPDAVAVQVLDQRGRAVRQDFLVKADGRKVELGEAGSFELPVGHTLVRPLRPEQLLTLSRQTPILLSTPRGERRQFERGYFRGGGGSKFEFAVTQRGTGEDRDAGNYSERTAFEILAG